MDIAPGATAAIATSTVEAAEDRVVDHYERRGRVLWGLAKRLGATDDEAADAVQEAHLRLWQELNRGAEIRDLDAWTFRVLYRLVMDQHRLGRRVSGLIGRLTSSTVEAVSHEVDDALSLWPLVDRLPARERATLYLRYRADLDFEQIGAVMGITAGAARMNVSRGVEKLRGSIGDDTGAPA